ncbi:MAG: hypothetical protein K2N27_10265 [Ruminococcus sp.]|nr:hypothetical protein [Ruminococcus sp.]
MIKYWAVRNVVTDTFLRNNDGDIMIFMDKNSGKYYILTLPKPELWKVVEFRR